MTMETTLTFRYLSRMRSSVVITLEIKGSITERSFASLLGTVTNYNDPTR